MTKNHSYVPLDFCNGGLQMTDLRSHIQSYKLTWIAKLLQGRPSKNIKNNFGKMYCKPWWDSEQILLSPIWYNLRISFSMFFKIVQT